MSTPAYIIKRKTKGKKTKVKILGGKGGGRQQWGEKTHVTKVKLKNGKVVKKKTRAISSKAASRKTKRAILKSNRKK